MIVPACKICHGNLWVCENHPEVPWDGDVECCGGAGMPCVCNPGDRDNPPKPLPGSVEIWSAEKGWVN